MTLKPYKTMHIGLTMAKKPWKIQQFDLAMPPTAQVLGPEDLRQFPMSTVIGGKEQGKANGDGQHNGCIQNYGIDLWRNIYRKIPGGGRFGIDSGIISNSTVRAYCLLSARIPKKCVGKHAWWGKHRAGKCESWSTKAPGKVLTKIWAQPNYKSGRYHRLGVLQAEDTIVRDRWSAGRCHVQSI